MTVHDDLYDPLQQHIIMYLEQFIKRKGSSDFHGGQFPDMADVAVYSSLSCRDNSPIWIDFIEYAFKGALKEWYFNMRRICQYREKLGEFLSLNESLEEE